MKNIFNKNTLNCFDKPFYMQKTDKYKYNKRI